MCASGDSFTELYVSLFASFVGATENQPIEMLMSETFLKTKGSEYSMAHRMKWTLSHHQIRR